MYFSTCQTKSKHKMKKNNSRKISINKIKISKLNNIEQVQVKGGGSDPCSLDNTGKVKSNDCRTSNPCSIVDDMMQ